MYLRSKPKWSSGEISCLRKIVGASNRTNTRINCVLRTFNRHAILFTDTKHLINDFSLNLLVFMNLGYINRVKLQVILMKKDLPSSTVLPATGSQLMGSCCIYSTYAICTKHNVKTIFLH